jgi:DNA-binding IclR family transcriptional regulator
MSPTKIRATRKTSDAPRRTSAPRQRPQDDGAWVDMDSAAQPGADGEDSQWVASVARALRLLNAFRPGEGPLGNAELAERTRLTKPTVSRLAYTLARCGYLSFNPKHRVYGLGPSSLALGQVALASLDVRHLARPLMQALARQANFNVGLGTRENHLMVYTDTCEGEALVGLRLFAGSRIPIITSAMGRAYLAGIEEHEREKLLKQLRPHYGDEWSGLEKALQRALREVERDGFCASVGDWQKDIHGVGAPIRSPAGGPVYAINLGGPAYLLPADLLYAELGPSLAEVARKVENALAPEAASIPEERV